MAFTKIEQSDLIDKGVIGLPDTPGLSTAAMQAKLEETARGVIIPKHNELIDELEATSSAENLGAVPLTGRTSSPNIQAVMEKLSTDLAAVEGSLVADTFKNIESGGATFTASGEDTFKINAGSNVTITPLSSPDKGIQISASGGGTSTGDMLMSDYDSQGNVKTAGGIQAYVSSAISGKADAADLATVATSGSYNDLSNAPSIPTKTSDLTNDSNFVADASYVHTDNNYDATAKGIVDGATAAIAAKSTVSWNQQITTGQRIAIVTIDGTPTDVYAPTGGSPGTGSVDSVNGYTGIVVLTASDVGALPDTTTIPTKVSDLTNDSGYQTASDVSTAIAGKADSSSLATVATSGSYADLSNKPTLATVATSGSYNDLSNKPTIPAAQVNSDWNAASGVAQILNKPTIPEAAKDGTLTIQQNGTTKGTFTANQSSDSSANIVTDVWHGSTATVSSGSVTFSGIDDSAGTNGYKLFINVTSSSTNKNPTSQISSISGEGTSSMSITFTTDADAGATAKLRIIK